MSFETSKCTARRMAQGHLQKLTGTGLDIGAGDDPFRPLSGVCRAWDPKHEDGDAAELAGVANASMDYVYASHCLEHLENPAAALKRWAEVIKAGGYLYVAVPDFELYEGGQAIRNRFHKTAFSLDRPSDMTVPLYNVIELLGSTLAGGFSLRYAALCDDNYHPDLPN